MKTLFLLLEFLTDGDAVRNVLNSCFTTGVVSVVVLFLLLTYQVLRRSYAPAPSRA
jgi:putative effector of murein hydrolase LrgA (UPF0299 family)